MEIDMNTSAIVQSMVCAPPDARDLFYSQEAKDADLGCIGHLRGDFGRGTEFWTTWWPHCEEYKTPDFVRELDALVPALREHGVLKDLASIRAMCSRFPGARFETALGYFYGFVLSSDHYAYYLRCFPERGDYNFYLYCYDKNRLKGGTLL